MFWLNYRAEALAGFHPCVLRSRSIRSLHHRPNFLHNFLLENFRRGTHEKSRLEARYLRVPCVSGLRPRPRSSDPRQDRRPATSSCIGGEVSLLFTTGEFTSCRADKSVRSTRLALQPGNMEHGWGLEPRPSNRHAAKLPRTSPLTEISLCGYLSPQPTYNSNKGQGTFGDGLGFRPEESNLQL